MRCSLACAGSDGAATLPPADVAGSIEGLYVAQPSALHRLPAHCKVVAAVLSVFAVVAAPREALWFYVFVAAAVGVLSRVAGLSAAKLARRVSVEIPFILFALVLPFISGGDKVTVFGLAVSSDGLWAAWNIVVKATLGVSISVILTATTTVPDLLKALDRLGLPKVVTAIASFMIRYIEVITGEMERMRIARISRGHDPRWVWQARVVAQSAGALFVRTYERGERVFLAMQSRGFDGRLVALESRGATTAEWLAALSVPTSIATLATLAWALR